MSTATFLSPTYLRIETVRQLRNIYMLVFTLAMPVAMYLIFGATASYGSQSAGNGNVAWLVAISMASFGAATAMAALGAGAASEISQGWGRQLALTPLTRPGYVVTKLLSTMAIVAISVAAVLIVAALTGARVDTPLALVTSVVTIVIGGCLFGLMGMGIGMFLRQDAASSIASIAVTFFAFFGNVFMPLSGIMLDIAHFTPMYGYVALARFPVTDGHLASGGADSMGMLLANVAAWAVVFAALTVVGIRRARARR